jgi:hypothetical protein
MKSCHTCRRTYPLETISLQTVTESPWVMSATTFRITPLRYKSELNISTSFFDKGELRWMTSGGLFATSDRPQDFTLKVTELLLARPPGTEDVSQKG